MRTVTGPMAAVTYQALCPRPCVGSSPARKPSPPPSAPPETATPTPIQALPEHTTAPVRVSAIA